MESAKLGRVTRTNRRFWLRAVAAIAGAVPVLAALRAYVAHNGAQNTITYVLGDADDVLPDGAERVLYAGDVPVLCRRQGANVTALELTCTHSSCPLAVEFNSRVIRCRCHGGAFDFNGEPTAAPPTVALRRHAASIYNEQLYLRIGERL